MEDREIVKLVISIQAKTGASCVYGAYELGKIIASGCKLLGYEILQDIDSEEIATKQGRETVATIYAFISPVLVNQQKC